ncbi:transglycosylase SLT domain-containing protein [Streptomyces litchfieldiae]|uniref:Transglycosylase SLT domain-containing protein n=1 Tax=Streptomyces litchfieldiae TaxID=3075543 RepID=A0ABU2MZH9_9ACTN|nr:transglycosylase SLT domain-containing protein [Streptomyces sp. DSM 44938]MDT0347060.1 transglycosylase SLT domain-containing protein [Streptomyces sp. DSM 44938]
MPATSTTGPRPTRTRRVSIAGVAAAGAAAVAVSLAPNAAAAEPAAIDPIASDTAAPMAFTLDAPGNGIATFRYGVATEDAPAAETPADEKAEDEKGEDEKTEDEKTEDEKTEDEKADEPEYPDNLDGWIREALAIMDEHGIPGSYEGIHRNIMRESSGDPNAINTWDINAINGTPSKGLLQVIQPTFDAYHVEGTAYDLYDPVANIVAACNYAADRYGSMDNVYSAY